MDHMLGRRPACFHWLFPAILLVAGGVTACFAQSESDNTQPADERTMIVQRFAIEKLYSWQRRLNLKDWEISIVVSPAGALKKNTVGNIRWDKEKKTAVIRVLDPADYKIPFDAILKDVEFTVVHELIHLEMSPVLADLNRTDANRMEEEYAVNHMTDALLKLDRGDK
jgi:hypothetical protein